MAFVVGDLHVHINCSDIAYSSSEKLLKAVVKISELVEEVNKYFGGIDVVN